MKRFALGAVSLILSISVYAAETGPPAAPRGWSAVLTSCLLPIAHGVGSLDHALFQKHRLLHLRQRLIARLDNLPLLDRPLLGSHLGTLGSIVTQLVEEEMDYVLGLREFGVLAKIQFLSFFLPLAEPRHEDRFHDLLPLQNRAVVRLAQSGDWPVVLQLARQASLRRLRQIDSEVARQLVREAEKD